MYFKEVLQKRLEFVKGMYKDASTSCEVSYWGAVEAELEYLIELYDDNIEGVGGFNG